VQEKTNLDHTDNVQQMSITGISSLSVYQAYRYIKLIGISSLRLNAPLALAPSRFHEFYSENTEKKGGVESFIIPHKKMDNGKAVRRGLAQLDQGWRKLSLRHCQK